MRRESAGWWVGWACALKRFFDKQAIFLGGVYGVLEVILSPLKKPPAWTRMEPAVAHTLSKLSAIPSGHQNPAKSLPNSQV